MSYAFPKSEKLCGRVRIASLYQEGSRFTSFPLRVTYMRLAGDTQPPRVLVWAPKSLFKHAVDRNRTRRLMREAYRRHAQPLRDYCAVNNCSFLLTFNYLDGEMRSQYKIDKAVNKALQRLINEQPTPQSTQTS